MSLSGTFTGQSVQSMGGGGGFGQTHTHTHAPQPHLIMIENASTINLKMQLPLGEIKVPPTSEFLSTSAGCSSSPFQAVWKSPPSTDADAYYRP